MPNLREVRISKGKKAKEIARAIGTDESMMSRFERYKCLPIPPMLSRLTQVLDCDVDDLYEPHELYLPIVKAVRKKKKKSGGYKLTVELPPEAREVMEGLGRLGYASVTDWARRCFEKLRKQYEKMQKEEGKRGIDPFDSANAPLRVTESGGTPQGDEPCPCNDGRGKYETNTVVYYLKKRRKDVRLGGGGTPQDVSSGSRAPLQEKTSPTQQTKGEAQNVKD